MAEYRLEEINSASWLSFVKLTLKGFYSPYFYSRFDNFIPEEKLIDLRVEINNLGAVSVYCFDGGKGTDWIGLMWPDFENEQVLSVTPFSTVVRSDSYEDFVPDWMLDFIEQSTLDAYEAKNKLLCGNK